MSGTKPKRDTQRSAVYAWEQLLPVWTPTIMRDIQGCQERVNEAWREFRSPTDEVGPPEVVRSTGRRRRGLYDHNTRTIILPAWAHFDCYVLHEAAHALTPDEQHGPVFVAQYLELMVELLGLNYGLATKLADNLKPRRVRYEW